MTGTYFLRNTKPTPQDAKLETRFEAAVFNTGNYFFEEALQQHIAVDETIYSFEELPQGCSKLVLSMSNFISPSTDLGWFADEIERKNVGSLVMVGAGAQADDYGDKVHLTEGTLRFLRVISERSKTIGVRGYFTAEVLSGYGVKNVDVIGCPTAFWANRRPIRTDKTPIEKIAVHLTPTGYYRDKIGQIFQHAIRHNAKYVIQSEQWMMPLMSNEFSDRYEELKTEFRTAYYSQGMLEPSDLASWIRNNSLIFFGMEPWINAMTKFDFVYGSRFHGNMAAIQAGTPALNMPYDTRTRELCEYLNIPHMPMIAFDPGMRIEHLRDTADFSVFVKTYSNRMLSYKEFLRRNGLVTHNLDELGACASQRGRVQDSFIVLLDRDLKSGAITEEEHAKEVELRRRNDRSIELRKQSESGATLPSGF